MNFPEFKKCKTYLKAMKDAHEMHKFESANQAQIVRGLQSSEDDESAIKQVPTLDEIVQSVQIAGKRNVSQNN